MKPAICRLLLGLCLFAPVATVGCAEERPPINRVQANALEKSIFTDSEWYFRQTVIDTPAQSTASFVGDSSMELRKIEWEIQEEFLIARDTRQHIDRIENDPIAGSGVVQTGVVAMYAIQSHFDIRREYNPTTGEELNIIGENTTDRPWYERRHFRVDWSKNLVSNEDLGLTSAIGGVTFEPVNYYVQDPEHPFAPKFEKNDDEEVYYVDIVNKYLASPETIELSTGDEFPACYVWYSGNQPCEPGEIAVRNSFLRVEPDRDYQPMEYTASRMERFGYFLTWRDGFDPSYGVTATGRLRFINRFNIWQQSHQRDGSGSFIECTQNSDCPGAGSECDLSIARAKLMSRGQCTIPYREREVKPVVFHVTEGFPEDLWPDARRFADDWNNAFRETVGSLRELECEEAGETGCAEVRERPDAENIFVLCHSPVRPGEHEACGPEGTVAHIGDLRYNIVGWVGDVTEGPLGYGPSFADPETGEIVASSAFVYGASLNTLAAYARDLVALINGDLSEETLTNNNDFAGWIRDVKSGRQMQPVDREAERHAVAIDGWDAPRINSAMSFEWMDDLLNRDPATLTKPSIDTAVERYENAKARLVDAVGELAIGDRGHARLDLVRGTDIEELMVDPEMRSAAGFGPNAPLNDTVLRAASPLRGMSINRMREVADLRRQLSGAPNSCLLKADFADDGLLGLVREINRAVTEGDGTVRWYGVDYDVARRNGDRVEIDYLQLEQMLRHPIFNAVTAHEVGHTLGLRHNFSGSFDSLNYHPRYWELRDDGNMESRAWDPMTQAEIDGRIREYQYSTVMDYGHNFVVTDAAGIGYYDVAAIKMGYGDLVEVFTNAPEETKQLVAQIGALQGFGWPGALDILGSGPLRSIPYTEMPALVGGLESLKQRADVRFRDLQEDPGLFRGVPVYDSDGRLVVPYRYCGDEFADYEPTCLRYDAGADEYETLTSIIDQYWNYYVVNNFMRQRIGFDPDDVPDRVYSRYFAKLEDANLYYSFYRGILGDFGATGDFYERKDGFGAYTAGVGAAYQLLTQVIATPEPGCHTTQSLLDGEPAFLPGSSLLTSSCAQSGRTVDIDAFDGRELRTGYSLGPDQSFWYLTRSGYFQDKSLALQVLTDPGARVLGQDTNVDIRRFQVSFYTTFQRPIQEVLRGVIGQDWHPFAARWNGSQIVYPAPDQQMTGTMDGVLVSPNLSFALELYSMVYGMAFLPRTFDYSFIDRGRLFVKGGAESVELQLPDGVTAVEFYDEESGLTYVAPSYPNEDGQETGVAAQVLLYAQQLQDAGETGALNRWMANLNVLRRLTYLMGFGGDDSSYL